MSSYVCIARIWSASGQFSVCSVFVCTVCFYSRYELAKAKVEQGKYLLKEDVLKKKEEKLLREKTEMAQFRGKKEQKYADNFVKQEREYKR